MQAMPSDLADRKKKYYNQDMQYFHVYFSNKYSLLQMDVFRKHSSFN
jgi:hypothetical protein